MSDNFIQTQLRYHKILSIENHHIDGIYVPWADGRNISNYLNRESLFNCQNLIKLPIFMCLKELYLSGCNIITLPIFKQLRILDISKTSICLVPNYESLEILRANHCQNLTEILSTEIYRLKITNCNKIKYLHQNLHKVSYLEAQACQDLITLPNSELINVDISYSRKVLRIPKVRSIKEIIAINCLSLISIPDFDEYTDHVNYNFTGCVFLSNPINLRKLIKLQLFFRRCLVKRFVAMANNFILCDDLNKIIATYIYKF